MMSVISSLEYLTYYLIETSYARPSKEQLFISSRRHEASWNQFFLIPELIFHAVL